MASINFINACDEIATESALCIMGSTTIGGNGKIEFQVCEVNMSLAMKLAITNATRYMR